jgi:hypothetical protein
VNQPRESGEKQGNGPASAGEFEPRTELEKIMAMENYMEWRKVTMTRRQANRAKSLLDELVPPPHAQNLKGSMLTLIFRRFTGHHSGRRHRVDDS